VSVTGSGVVQLELIKGRRRNVYMAKFPSGRKKVFIQVRQRGRFSLRVRYRGGCRQSSFTV